MITVTPIQKIVTVNETTNTITISPMGAQGVGVQAGGTTGQILAKVDATDFNTQWVDVAGVSGSGDMTKAVYDTNNSGAVDSAETAPWSGISGKPTLFPPDTHTHAYQPLSDDITAIDAITETLGFLKKTALNAWSIITLSKSDVGLSDVDNTSDADKPISTATATALSGKVDDSQVLTDVPLGAVFTDTIYTHPLTHPASIITQDTNNRFVTDAEKSAWNGKAETTAVTTLTNGLMIASDKVKLDAITGTNTGDQDLSAYALTSNVHNVNSGGTAGQVLSKIDSTDFNTQWVTPSSGGGVPFWTPKIKSLLWTNFRNGGSVSAGGAFNTGSIHFSPFNIFQTSTITNVAVKLSSTTALDFKIVIYSSDATNPLLINLVYESVVISTTTASGTYSTTLPTPLVLDPTKLYWMGVTHSNSNYRGDWLDINKGAAPLGYFVGSVGSDWALSQAGLTHTLVWGSAIPSQITLNTSNSTSTGISISMKVQ